MHVDVEPAIEILGDAEVLGARAHVAHGGLCRFLHDVAELAGQRQASAPGHERGLGDENLAAHFRPCQACRDADFVLLFRQRRPIAGTPRNCVTLSAVNLFVGLGTFADDLASDFAANRVDLALQVADAGFTACSG